MCMGTDNNGCGVAPKTTTQIVVLRTHIYGLAPHPPETKGGLRAKPQYT